MSNKKFVILTQEDNKNITDTLTNYFKTNNLAYWHWLPNSYLMIDPKGNKTASTIRNDLRSVLPSLTYVVLEATGNIDWAGRGQTETRPNMFEWIISSWSKF